MHVWNKSTLILVRGIWPFHQACGSFFSLTDSNIHVIFQREHELQTFKLSLFCCSLNCVLWAAFTRQPMLANWCVWTTQQHVGKQLSTTRTRLYFHQLFGNSLPTCCCVVYTHQFEFASTSWPLLVWRVKAVLDFVSIKHLCVTFFRKYEQSDNRDTFTCPFGVRNIGDPLYFLRLK